MIDPIISCSKAEQQGRTEDRKFKQGDEVEKETNEEKEKERVIEKRRRKIRKWT